MAEINDSTTTEKRRRRTAAQARSEILDAAEQVLLEVGPSGLQLKEIAGQAGLSLSNVHHHFGGVGEVQSALVERMLKTLTANLSSVFERLEDVSEPSMEEAIRAVYDIVGSPRYARLIAWMVMSFGPEKLVGLSHPLIEIRAMIVERLKKVVTSKDAEMAAPMIIHHIAVAAVGEGLIGDVLRATLNHTTHSHEVQGDMLVGLVEKLASRKD